ncbi:hypothetical protein SPSIL_010550 [Sporomusa silvacetica DSM 10669]|uniref:Coenzyme PQQ synthesis protein D n=1 Tax=Sporomusa silvacetica DSM 10669 TaxID=1123289 RepID=A0ABZ3IH01_9FIRM|nr:lasso peptide biosynthesis PqqD family chaperone [Sporomusa silvacetica]OZC21431.1 coenzyme PQQ synthesis protein D [Sporomusa silvacetica DSM 10669]
MALKKLVAIHTVVTQAPGLLAADMDGETVMLNIEKGTYYGLDGIGSRIWQLIEKPHTVRSIVATLLEEYDVEGTACQNDVLDFLNQLSSKGLILVA